MAETRKIAEGETIRFSDFIVTPAFTRFGESAIVSFADDKGEIFRKVFSESLGKYMEKNKPQKSVTLKKKLVDGEYNYNVYSHDDN